MKLIGMFYFIMLNIHKPKCRILISCCLFFPRELVDSLHQRNVKVFLISGGFRCIVEHVAAQLNIPQHHVYANRLKFYFNGECSSRKNHFRRLAKRSVLLLLQLKSFMPCNITHKSINPCV